MEVMVETAKQQNQAMGVIICILNIYLGLEEMEQMHLAILQQLLHFLEQQNEEHQEALAS